MGRSREDNDRRSYAYDMAILRRKRIDAITAILHDAHTRGDRRRGREHITSTVWSAYYKAVGECDAARHRMRVNKDEM